MEKSQTNATNVTMHFASAEAGDLRRHLKTHSREKFKNDRLGDDGTVTPKTNVTKHFLTI